MDREIEAEIRKKLLGSRFYRPLNKIPIELAMDDYTVYVIDGTESFVQPWFQPSENDSVNSQPSTSMQFEETIVNENGRICQLCGRAYKTKRHQTLFREKNTCCVCREIFASEELLIQHFAQTIKAKICCVKNCHEPVYDVPKKNESHFNRHVPKKGNVLCEYSRISVKSFSTH